MHTVIHFLSNGKYQSCPNIVQVSELIKEVSLKLARKVQINSFVEKLRGKLLSLNRKVCAGLDVFHDHNTNNRNCSKK